MARARASALSFDAIQIEGAFIAPDMLGSIAALEAREQTDADYNVEEGLKLRDEIGRYFRIAEALWARFDRVREPDAGGLAAREFVTGLLTKVFGFTTLESVPGIAIGDRSFPVHGQALGG